MEDTEETMNDYERYGRFWTFIQLSYKMINEKWLNINGMPRIDDPDFQKKLRKTKEQVKLLHELIDSICPDEN